MWEVIQATNHLEHFLHYLSEFSFCYHTSKQLERKSENRDIICDSTKFLQESEQTWNPLVVLKVWQLVRPQRGSCKI